VSALLTRGRPGARRVREVDCRALPEPEAGPTLDDVVSRTWELLRAEVPAGCPACGSELAPRQSAGAGVVGGRCDGCGTTLA